MMTLAPVPNQATIQTILGNFLASIMPAGVGVYQGQINRVPEPVSPDFVIFTELFQKRLATNEDSYADVAFIGSIAGTVLTVTSVEYGAIAAAGDALFGVNVADGTLITRQISGSAGGVGTYAVSIAQAVSSELMACGNELLSQSTELTFQIDCHGQNSADNAQTISTLFRDDRGTSYFYNALSFGMLGITPLGRNTSLLAPLYADDPRQVPYLNDQQQVEFRWVITACLHANQIIVDPQQFAQELNVMIEPLYKAS